MEPGAALLSGLSSAVIVSDRNGHILLANDAAERLLGYAPGSLAGRGIEELVPPRMREWHQAARRSYAETPVRRGVRPGSRLLALCADGSELPVEIELSPVRLEHESVVVATLRPLEAGAVDREERERARGEIQAASVAIVGAIADSFRREGSPEVAVAHAIRRCIDAAGLPSGALYLLEDGELRPSFAFGELAKAAPEAWGALFDAPALLERAQRPDDVVVLEGDDAAKLLARAGAKSAILAPLASGGSYLGLLLVLSPDGELASEPWRAFARAVAAQLAQTVMLGRSLTELRDAEIWRRALFESAPDGMMVLDRDGAVLECNPAAAELFGATAEQLSGRHFGTILERAGAAKTSFEQLMSRGGVERVHYQRDDGRPGVIDISATNVRSKRKTSVLVVLRDVEAQEQLLRADRLASVGLLAAGVAHEINNPLAAAVANVAFVSDALSAFEREDPDLRSALDDLSEALAQVRSIVVDLRHFARADAGAPTEVDLTRVVESALRLAHNEIRHRARVIRELGPVPPVLGHEARIAQVVLNLIVNAAQAIPEGASGQHEIRLRLARGGDEVILEVSDTGSGMPDEVLSRLFTPFFTTKPPGLGTGLGLSIAHRIVSDMGGTIDVESQVGRGSTFRLRLPGARG